MTNAIDRNCQQHLYRREVAYPATGILRICVLITQTRRVKIRVTFEKLNK